VTVEGDGRGRLEKFTIEGGEDADDIIGAGRGLYDASAVDGMSVVVD
jgi:hypothetical protein